MKNIRMFTVEGLSRKEFEKKLNAQLIGRDIFSVKCQRNLFYAGVGSSEGYKGRGIWPWSKKNREQKKIRKGKIALQESYLAFVFVKGGKKK